MKTAERFAAAFKALPRDEQERLDCNFPYLRGFYDAWCSLGTVTYPFGQDSHDPSFEIQFEDGSTVHIGNPFESCFQAYVSVSDDDIVEVEANPLGHFDVFEDYTGPDKDGTYTS